MIIAVLLCGMHAALPSYTIAVNSKRRSTAAFSLRPGNSFVRARREAEKFGKGESEKSRIFPTRARESEFPFASYGSKGTRVLRGVELTSTPSSSSSRGKEGGKEMYVGSKVSRALGQS